MYQQTIQHFRLTWSIRGRVMATLARGSLTCPLPIVLGRANNSAMLKENMTFQADCQDFLCVVPDYAPGGVVVDPAVDDTLTITKDGVSTVYELRPATDTEQVFQMSPANDGPMIRIHTKAI